MLEFLTNTDDATNFDIVPFYLHFCDLDAVVYLLNMQNNITVLCRYYYCNRLYLRPIRILSI